MARILFSTSALLLAPSIVSIQIQLKPRGLAYMGLCGGMKCGTRDDDDSDLIVDHNMIGKSIPEVDPRDSSYTMCTICQDDYTKQARHQVEEKAYDFFKNLFQNQIQDANFGQNLFQNSELCPKIVFVLSKFPKSRIRFYVGIIFIKVV